MVHTLPKIIARSRRTTLPLAFAVLLSSILSASAPKCQAWVQETKPATVELKTATLTAEELQQIRKLLTQLDSPSYEAREQATQQLIALGSLAIKPITVHFFESSSEAGWRINRILEGIGTSGSEDDFLRTAAIIQQLFGTQNSRSVEKLQQLQRQWKVTRREDAATKLRRLGFKIVNTQPVPRAEFEFGGGIMIRRGVIVDVPFTEVPDEEELDQATAASQWSDPRDNRQQSILQIEKIIANDTETNRELIAEVLPQNLGLNSLPACQLTIPTSWKPDSSAVELIAAMSPIGSVQMTDQKVDNDLLNLFAAENSLSMMSFSNCDFEAIAGQGTALPPSVNELSFVGALPRASVFKAIETPFSLVLQKVELTEEIAKQLYEKQVRAVYMKEVGLSQKSLSRLLRTRSLTQVTFSLCQFELDWLSDARQNRPELSIVADPVAFLGVQGPMDISNRNFKGCQISQVVPGTGAANAGMQANDIVIAMGDQKIATFEDLRLLISQKRPAEKMGLKILRGKETLELEIKLGTPNQ